MAARSLKGSFGITRDVPSVKRPQGGCSRLERVAVGASDGDLAGRVRLMVIWLALLALSTGGVAEMGRKKVDKSCAGGSARQRVQRTGLRVLLVG